MDLVVLDFPKLAARLVVNARALTAREVTGALRVETAFFAVVALLAVVADLRTAPTFLDAGAFLTALTRLAAGAFLTALTRLAAGAFLTALTRLAAGAFLTGATFLLVTDCVAAARGAALAIVAPIPTGSTIAPRTVMPMTRLTMWPRLAPPTCTCPAFANPCRLSP